MRHIPTLLRRELASYFLGPMAFLVLLAFQAIAWLNFWDLVESLARNGSPANLAMAGLNNPMTAYVAGSPAFWVGLLVAIPALTMRLVAEERRSGTIEPLLTAPVTETEVILAKWLAGLAMYLALILPFALYLPFLYFGGEYRFDPGPVLALGVGLTSMGMMLIAVGLLFSTLTRNQLVAAVLTFAALFLFLLLTRVGYNLASMQRSRWTDVILFVSVIDQVNTLAAGRLDLRFVALHVSATVLMLYLAVKVLQYRREG